MNVYLDFILRCLVANFVATFFCFFATGIPLIVFWGFKKQKVNAIIFTVILFLFFQAITFWSFVLDYPFLPEFTGIIPSVVLVGGSIVFLILGRSLVDDPEDAPELIKSKNNARRSSTNMSLIYQVVFILLILIFVIL